MHETQIVAIVDRYECTQCGEIHNEKDSVEKCCLDNPGWRWRLATRYACPVCKREHVFLSGAMRCCREE